MENTNRRNCDTEANYLDTCIFSTGILQIKTVVTGRLAGWVRCEQPNGGYGNWFLIFVYPLYQITQLDDEFQKILAPDNIRFMCLCVHGCAAVDIIHTFTTYSDTSKFAIAFVIDEKTPYHFSTDSKENLTFDVITIHSLVFLSGNVTSSFNNFDGWKKREVALVIDYLSRKGEFCSGICKMSDKDIEVFTIFEDEDGFDVSDIELEQKFKKLHNLAQRVYLLTIANANQSEENISVIDLIESEDTNTLSDTSKTSRKLNQLETLESERKIKSRNSANSEELSHTEENIESLWKTVTGQCKIFGSRRVTDGYNFGIWRNSQPQFLPTSFKILDSLQSITMSVMIDCNSPQTELRSRGAYDPEFDEFLANKDK